MNELRRDPVVGRWVIINHDHKKGPAEFEKEDHTPKQAATCQFCPGKEHQTPPEVEVIRSKDSKPDTAGWSLRIFKNKFPALQFEGELQKQGVGIYDFTNGVGEHEVLVETPDHFKSMADLTPVEMLGVIQKYVSRCKKLSEDERFKYVMIFKNFGESAGATVEHAHSQIIALPMVPKYVLEELDGAESYFLNRGRCIYCDIINQENFDKERIVTSNSDFLAFCPFTSRYAYETWIIPKSHRADFSEIKDSEQESLAAILKETLLRIKSVLSNPSYNFYLHIAPTHYAYPESYHWHIEIIPQLTRVAGFEWGTGLHIVSTDPKEAATHLRQA